MQEQSKSKSKSGESQEPEFKAGWTKVGNWQLAEPYGSGRTSSSSQAATASTPHLLEWRSMQDVLKQ